MSARRDFEVSEMSSKVRDFRHFHGHFVASEMSSILDHQSSILILILNTSSILNLELSISNSCSKIATKVRDLRPKMSSKVRDFRQNVRTHRVQLFPSLCVTT